ncbi:MAG: PQQ-binding-like beta-propeller repeat protein [Alphaproteobacteria bacterium]|nr:PQQ-binding-like beta-propeller repeat protein [Alphaproteobacteria bacterium]
MPRSRPVLSALTGLLLLVLPGAAQAAEPPGDASASGPSVYKQYCAACHENPALRAPTIEALRQTSPESLFYTLSVGRMQAQAKDIPPDQLLALVDWLTGRNEAAEGWIARAACPAPLAPADLDPPATIASWGLGPDNARTLTAEAAGFTRAQVPDLELVWAMGFPSTSQMRSQPVIVGKTLFLLIAELSRVFAIDIDTGCLRWVHASDAPLRTSLSYLTLPEGGRKVLVFGDSGARVHMIDALTAERIWMTDTALFDESMVTGSPVAHEGRLYVPVSSYEISKAQNPQHECCRSHGAVHALDLSTGEILWTTPMMRPAEKTRLSSVGTQLWGPSGAPVWTTPAIDARRGLLYVGTGENTSAPATDTSDAIVALDLETGAVRWVFQATEQDLYNNACGFRRSGPNCPDEGEQLDFDFGASVVIARGASGREVLLAGQKSGTLWALDPDREGALLWQVTLGQGSPLGGIHWGLAADAGRVMVPVNDPGTWSEERSAYRPGPGLHGVDIDTGTVLWSRLVAPHCPPEREAHLRRCGSYFGMSGSAILIDGVVFNGTLDGRVFAHDAASGEALWSFDTARDFDTRNGVPARGGAIDNAAIVAAGGLLFVQSGYSMHGQSPGNVLLAFRPAPGP